MSNQVSKSTKLGWLRRWLIALAVVVSVGLASSPAHAASLNGSRAHAAHASPAHGSASIRITDVEYNSVFDGYRGMLVHIYLDVVGLQGTPIRVAVFFNWDDDTTLYADPNAPVDFVTTSGALTAQNVVTPSYNDTYWSDFKLFVPYLAFPSVSTSQGAYLYPAVGVDGQDFAVYGDNVNFTLNP